MTKDIHNHPHFTDEEVSHYHGIASECIEKTTNDGGDHDDNKAFDRFEAYAELREGARMHHNQCVPMVSHQPYFDKGELGERFHAALDIFTEVREEIYGDPATIGEVRTILYRLTVAQGREVAVNLLEEAGGVKHLTKLRPEKFDAVFKAANDKLGRAA
jgi:hypothetical protein